MGIHRRSPMEITARAGWWFCLLVFLCTTTTVEMTDTTVELLDDAFSVDKLDHVMELSPNDQKQVDRTVREALAKMDAPHQKEKAESKRKIPTSSVSLGSSSRLQQEARSRIKHYYPHTTAKVWQTNTLKSCVFQKGAKYRGYKVPKYLCYPGGHMENVTTNGVTQSKLISGGTDDCLEMKVDKT